MSTSEFYDVWQLMSEYNFETDPETLNENLWCIICHKLMVDACHGVCGCRYCFSCISEYLKDENRHCPGGKTVCNDDHLVMERDVSRTVRINGTISKLKVMCPNNRCQSKIELINMAEHLRVCKKQTIQCPYVTLGCDKKDEAKDEILTHLNNENLIHVQLLIEWVHNLKNEVDGLKDNVSKYQMEISSLKEESRMKDIQIEKIIEQIALQKREIVEQMSKTKMETIDQILKETKEMIEEMKTLETQSADTSANEKRIVTLGKKLREVQSECKYIINEETKERKNEIGQHKEDIDNIRKDGRIERENIAMMVNNIKRNVNEMKEERDKYDTYRNKAMLKWNKLCANIDADVIWRINSCTQKRGTYFHSDPFYANNYKFCLRLYIYYEDIGLFCHIMKGENDDKVQWPMKRTMTLAILDQDALKVHKSCIYKCDSFKGEKCFFDKPNTDMNGGIGEFSFMKYTSKNKSSAIVNDSIIVSCVISDL